MIIIQNPEKDTYVTDIQTTSNNGINANVGQSSTIDLFKITGENNKTFSRALLTISNTIINGNTFTIKDSLGSSVTFIIRTLEETVDGSVEINGQDKKVKVGLSGALTEEAKCDRFISAINNVNSFNNGLTLDVTAYKLDSSKILLKQNKPGSSGDTIPVVPDNESSVNITNFVRFEHSAALLNFKISDLKTAHLPDNDKIDNSVFKADRKFKAILRLIDVGKSSTRPKDFSLKLNILNSDFKEGLGKDIVHFSDLDDANFVTLDSKNNINWTNQGIVSSQDLYSDFTFSDFNFESGKEDLEIDITNYVHEFFKETAGADKENFVIHFPTDFLFDNNTYFVKRFGSRNLKNKRYIPQLILKIDDREIENIITDKKRYFDNEENFYLLNIKGNKTSSFVAETPVHLKFEFIGDESLNIFSGVGPIVGSEVYNYKGEKVAGIRKFAIADSVISQISSDSVFLKQIKDLGFAKIKLEYYYQNADDTTTLIKSVTEKFYPAEADQNEISFDTRNIRVSIDLLQKNLLANNSIVPLKVSFIDINRQYKSVNTRVELYSEDLGDINYEMYDVDSGDKIIKEDGVYTQMSFNGKHYVLNLFCSENYKNKRINFSFKYSDPLTGLHRKVKNDNTILRFV